MIQKFKEERMNKYAPSLAHATDLNGSSLDTTSLANKVVVLYFWGTQCTQCLNYFPYLQEVYNHFKDNPQVKFVILNWALNNSLKQARKWAEKHDYTFPLYYDKNSKISKAFRVLQIPTMYILGKNGRIQFKDVNFNSPSIMNKLSLQIGLVLKHKLKPKHSKGLDHI